jgi:SAM-dependent methyltransferase
LYGATFTALPRIAGGEEAVKPDGGLSPAARARVRDFVAALAAWPTNERLRFAADFLRRRGVSVPAMPALLDVNLERFLAEQRAYQQTLASAAPDQLLYARSTLYSARGLSVDTSLLPNFAIEDTLRAMLRKGALVPGAIHRVAIVGPGLDFADKRGGYDYYPLQTIQPFAILEAVARLGFGGADEVTLSAFDLNPAVVAHIREAARHARAGRVYTIQLPREAQADLTPPALAYWQHFGDVIGAVVPAIGAPSSLKQAILSRAVAVQPRYAARLDVFDLDIVAQTLDLPPAESFDLVVATNILVYYDLFHQALAKAAIAHMLNPGGVLLVNHALPSQPASLLEYLGRRSVAYSSNGAYGDDVVVYRRRKLAGSKTLYPLPRQPSKPSP